MSDTSLGTLATAVRQLMQRLDEGGALSAGEFNSLAVTLADAQRRYNPAYGAYVKSLGGGPPANWTDIPAVPTEAFKAMDLTCIPPAERTHFFQSSGTTAQDRSRHWHHAESLSLYDASVTAWSSRQLFAPLPGLPTPKGGAWQMLSLTPPLPQAPHSSLVHMLDIIFRRWGAPASQFLGQSAPDGGWTLAADDLLTALRQAIRDNQPVFLFGTAFNFVHFLDYLRMEAEPLPLPAGSRLMETGGYKGHSRALPREQLHRELQTWLGLPPAAIISEYGMCELGSQAYAIRASDSPPARLGFHFPPWARFRIRSPEDGSPCPDGEPGLLCVYDLANVWSVLAIQTADLAVAHGDGFELLGRAATAEPRGCSLMASP